jgi:uncharacterized membrane protein
LKPKNLFIYIFKNFFLIMRACSPLSSPLTKLLASLIYSYTSAGVLALTNWLRLMCQSGATCLYVEGLVSELALYKPEALKSLYRSPGYKKKQLALCKNYVLQW